MTSKIIHQKIKLIRVMNIAGISSILTLLEVIEYVFGCIQETLCLAPSLPPFKPQSELISTANPPKAITVAVSRYVTTQSRRQIPPPNGRKTPLLTTSSGSITRNLYLKSASNALSWSTMFVNLSDFLYYYYITTTES